jgi:hypothetical protein
VTIEHGHANRRGDDLSSVAFWYQAEPHLIFPPLVPVEQRLANLSEAIGTTHGSEVGLTSL